MYVYVTGYYSYSGLPPFAIIIFKKTKRPIRLIHQLKLKKTQLHKAIKIYHYIQLEKRKISLFPL